ncbi:hypothetical protein ACFOVU_18645 [Nocardiopsis sediminis]|uniref:Uncharacterized protein n=1 Tax=Nocardiopsis sediminis TaxID=1778267 RepID=A0ABV8FP66_9ACTN
MSALISLAAFFLVAVIVRVLAGGWWPDRRSDLDNIRRFSQVGDRR